MMDGLKDAHREAIIAEIAANERVERAVLFGSRATGTNTVSSDVDIALFGNRLTLTDRARLAAALDEIPMAQSVDLLLYDSVRNPTLQEHIRRQGVEWYARSRDAGGMSSARQRLGILSGPDGEEPEVWPTVRLGDAVDLLTGFPFRSDGYVSDSAAPRLLRGDNIAQGHLRWDGAKRWPAEAAAPMEKFRLCEGDVVLAMDRPWIEAGLKFSSVRREDLPALLVQRVARLRGGESLDTWFLKYVIGCRDFSDYVLSVQTGTAVPHISARQIEDYECCLPPLNEQRAIVHILGTLDDKIELNRRMNATLEAMARALFRSWFVDFDPVRARMEGRDTGLPKEIDDLFPDRLVDSVLGKIPKGWVVGTLGDIADAPRSAIDPGQVADDTPYIGLEHMPRRSVALTDWGTAGRVSSAKTVFENRDMLFGKLRPYFHKVGIAPVNGVCSTDIVVLKARPSEWSAFVLACVSSSGFVGYASQTSTGTKMPRTSWRTMSRYEMCRPADAVAATFQHAVSPMIERIITNVHESRTLGRLRDTLLPRLVSGELRAPLPLVGAEMS